MTAQIKVGNNLVKPKAIHVFKNGEWQKERMGYVYKSGQWMPIIEYEKWIYQEGQEYIRFNASGELEKEKDNLSLTIKSTDTNYSKRGFLATEEQVNINNYNQLYVDLSSLYDSHSNQKLEFGLSKDDDFINALIYNSIELPDASSPRPVNLPRSIYSLDISDVTGDFYIYAFMRLYSSESKLNVKIYNIWLE